MGLIGKFIAIQTAKAVGVAVSKRIDKKETAKRSTEQIVQNIVFDNALFGKHDSSGARYDAAKYIIRDVDGNVLYRMKSRYSNTVEPVVYLLGKNKNYICEVVKEEEYYTDKYGERYRIAFTNTNEFHYMYRQRKSIHDYSIEIVEEEESGFFHKHITPGVMWHMVTSDKIINFEATVLDEKGEEIIKLHSTADEQQDDGFILEYKYEKDQLAAMWIAVAALMTHGKY